MLWTSVSSEQLQFSPQTIPVALRHSQVVLRNRSLWSGFSFQVFWKSSTLSPQFTGYDERHKKLSPFIVARWQQYLHHLQSRKQRVPFLGKLCQALCEIGYFTLALFCCSRAMLIGMSSGRRTNRSKRFAVRYSDIIVAGQQLSVV